MPSLSNKVDVLVVGAGPIGLLTALELSRAGAVVEIIDRAWRSTAQSYACGLHGATLELLARLGFEAAVQEASLRIDTMAFYEGRDRRAELRFDSLHSPRPGLAVLPQDRLEEILEEGLRARGIRVRWGHRLDDLRQDENAVHATVEKLGVTSTGYPFARSEDTVEKEIEVRARFVVGADGASSHVRQLLGLATRQFGSPTAYDVFEFEPIQPTLAGGEVRVAFGPSTVDVFWPQPASTCRWSLEVGGTEADHPGKERASIVVVDPAHDPAEHQRVNDLIRGRAPWFEAGVKEIDWTTVVGFERMMVEKFGTGRCWLVGDAAHQTGPVGMQSMNVGLREAEDLAGRLSRILLQGASPELLAEYERSRLEEWSLLLGARGGLEAGSATGKWTGPQRKRLLPCLPASGADLAKLAGQLGLTLA